jgi:TPR repeat protein
MGVFVGIFMGGVGIVPLGMLASLFNGDWYAIGILVFGLALTFGARIIAIMLAAWIDRYEVGINSNSPSLSLAPQPSKRALVTALGLVLVGSVGVWLVETQRPITDDPFAAMTRGDYPTALRLVRPLADQGDAVAQNNLGVMYDRGHGVLQNYAEAMKWYRLSADQGYAVAQSNLGLLYTKGHGVPQNYAEAVKWERLAADQGDANAQYNLALMYEDGEGVPQDYAEAMKWYRLAADQGNALSQSALGFMYDRGHGVQNYAEAVKWYRKAADQGEASGQNRLGVMYFYGNGVPQNYVEAMKWFRLAADQGDATAQSNLGLMYVTATACRRTMSALTCGSTCRRRRATKMG